MKLFMLVFLLFESGITIALSLDEKLKIVINEYSLESIDCTASERNPEDPYVLLGEFFFQSKLLSGNSDTSCSTCHIESQSLTDGLPISVGVSGEGEGEDRLYSDGVLVPRNSFTLFGRSLPGYKTFFWDGKVQEIDGEIFSSIGNGFDFGFDSSLSVAAVMPILARDEFLGDQGLIIKTNDVAVVNTVYYQDQYHAANSVLKEKLLHETPEVSKLKALLTNAEIEEFNLAIVGNALARFIDFKSKDCEQPLWQLYLDGDLNALSKAQKRGALVFYGKGRCAVCHSGSVQSDFQFHSLGLPQGGFGPYIHGQDIGRAGVTNRLQDRFKFRTPPLLFVSKTAPYGHNGAFQTLREAVLFHINPIEYLSTWEWSSDREFFKYGGIISTRSEILGFIDIRDQTELDELIDFIETL